MVGYRIWGSINHVTCHQKEKKKKEKKRGKKQRKEKGKKKKRQKRTDIFMKRSHEMMKGHIV